MSERTEQTEERRQAICHGPAVRREQDEPPTLAAVLTRAAERWPDRATVVVGADGTAAPLPYPELLARARTVLGALRREGLRPGDTLVLYGLELADYFPAFWACVLGGIVPLPVDVRREAEARVRSVERVAGACRLLDDPRVLTDAAGAADLAGHPATAGLRVLDATARRESEPGADDVADAPAPAGSDPALLMLSSGSTGTPKIIPLTHEALLDFLPGSRQALGWGEEDSTLSWLPVDASAALLLYHVLPVYLGSDNVQVPTELVLADPVRWFDLVTEHRSRHTWAPAFGFRLIRSVLAEGAAPAWDLSHVRTLVSGGEQIPDRVVDGFLAATAPYGVDPDCFVPCWGMTETTTAISWSRYRAPGSLHRLRTDSLGGATVTAGEDVPDDLCTTFVAVGAPAPGASLRVVDADGRIVDEGTVGLLQVRSIRNTPGYLANPEANARTFVADADGGLPWLDTGDLAFIRDGQAVMIGRQKDIVVINGENHPCHAIEAVVEAVPGVAAGGAAACGVPDEELGTEALALFFAPSGDRPVEKTRAEIGREVLRRLGLFPRHIVPLAAAEFPRTSSGKVQRRELAARLTTQPPAPDATPVPAPAAVSEPAAVSDPTSATAAAPAPTPVPAPAEVQAVDPAALLALLRAEIDALAPVTLDPAGGDDHRPFYELGLGSVSVVRLRRLLGERLGVDLPVATFFEHPTVVGLADHLADLGIDTTAPALRGDAPREPMPAGEPIAVIGMGLRFPGAATPEEYWANLRAGTGHLTAFGPEQLREAGLSEAEIASPDRVPVGGFLAGADEFDPEFFGLSPREAELTHPAHRLFLECSYHALESAGYAEAAAGTRIGVYAGEGANLTGYQSDTAAPDPELADGMQSALGSLPDYLASRVSYRLGLSGPAIGVRTACSTSLVAVHLAVQALREGDADLALAGAASLQLPQGTGYRYHPESVLSPTGACRPFDAGADGTVGGNGVAVVLLKPLAAALADGDPVLAVITGTAVNNDGARKIGFTAPSVQGQVEVVRKALQRAGVRGTDLSYVEAHGTGTPVGDPVEFAALGKALGADSPDGPGGFCAVGSVKAAIGHLDSCAGMAALIKVILMLRHRELVPTRALTRPNPELALGSGPLYLATEVGPLPFAPGGSTVLRAGVNALGVGGTNAFAVLEEAPVRTRDAAAAPGARVVPLSGRDEDAVRRCAAELAEHLRAAPDLAVADVAATHATRPRFAVRAAVAGASAAELALALDGLASDTFPGTGRRSRQSTPGAGTPGPIAFAFSGQGSARRGMARELYAALPVVRETLDRCEHAHRAATGEPGLLSALLADGGTDEPLPTSLGQPALVALQLALTEQWRAWGVEPALVLGHSLGEISALYAAGALSLADTVRLAARRGQLMQTAVPEGGMLAFRADTAVAERVARESGAELAARNGGGTFVVSGTPLALRHAHEVLDRLGVAARRLPVDRAFHSGMLDVVLQPLAEAVAACALAPLAVPMVTAADGLRLDAGTVPPADYLVRQARVPVRFDLALAGLHASGCATVLELGPQDDLTRLGRRALPELAWTTSQLRDEQQDTALMLAAGELHCAGHPLDWARLTEGGRSISLPGYPFRRTRFARRVPAGATAAVPAPRPEPVPPVPPAPAAAPTAAADGLLDRVTRLTAERFGLDPAGLDADRTFVALGGDSLSLVGLTRRLERELGVRVPMRAFFDEADTPRRLAGLLATRGAQPPAPAAAPPTAPAELRAPNTTVRPAAPAEPPGPDASVRTPGAEPTVPADSSPATPVPAPQPVAGELAQLCETQLRVAQDMFSQVTGLMDRQLSLWATATPAPQPTTTPTATPAVQPAVQPAAEPVAPSAVAPSTVAPAACPPAGPSACDYSLYFFGDYPDQQAAGKYEHVLAAAEFADFSGFHALWLPERHFDSFGGIFPNPSVLAAAVATRTSRIRLHAGSVVLPLHDPIRVAEEWSVVDNLSQGRAGIGVASGWHADDFVLAPQNYGRHRELMYEGIETVRRLWAGERVKAVSGTGATVEVGLFPRPVQAQPPMFVAVVGNPDSYRRAAAEGLGVVTNLMTQSVADLAANIALYRSTRAEHGLDPAGGRVVVLMHSYLGADPEQARREAAGPFRSYLRSSLSLLGGFAQSLGLGADLDRADPEDVDFLLDRAFDRYCEDRALIGSPESCRPVAEAVVAAGADEIACFVDFGVPTDRLLAALPLLARLRDIHRPAPSRAGTAPVPTPVPTPAPAPAPATPAYRLAPLAPVHPTPPAVAARLPEPRTAAPALAPEPVPVAVPVAVPVPAAPAAAVPASPPLPGVATPATPAQRRLWLVDRMYPGRTDYHEPKALVLTGPLDVEALRGALDRVAARHPQLRTVFREVGGELHQVALPPAPLPCPPVDLSGLPDEEAFARLLADERDTVLDLATGPLVRLRLARLAPERHVLFLLAHHIVFDSASTEVFCRDLAAHYRAWPQPPAGLAPLADEPPAGPASAARSLEFWLAELAGAPVLALPADRPASTAGPSGARGRSLLHEFGPELADGVTAFARSVGATPFMVLLAGLGTVLGRLAGQDDFMLGTAVANRPEGTEDRIGMFIETVVLRMDLSGDPGFDELVRRVRERTLHAYEHQDVPFDELVAALNPERVAGANPLFGVMVEYENHTPLEFAPPGVGIESVDLPSDRAPFELTFYLTRHRQGLRCAVEYDAGRFEESTVRRVLDYLEQLLHRAGPARLSALTAPTAADRAALAAVQGEDTGASAEPLHRLVERSVDADPQAPALLGDGFALTYRELDESANRLAHALAGIGAGPGVVVGVSLPAGPELVVALLAVLKSGAAYLPLDRSLPADRVAHCLSAAGTALLLTDSTDRASHALPTVLVDEDRSALPATRPQTAVDPDSPAYCIFTSGSTGRPKGVLVPHRGPVNLVRWQLRTGPALRTLQWTSPGFDVSVQEIFATLASGAALVLVPEELRGDPAELSAAMRRHGVERLHMAGTPFRYLVEHGLDVPTLREVRLAGEQLVATPALRRFLDGHPSVELFNEYGPTEASVIALSHRVTDLDEARVPIGRPVDNAGVHIVDAAGRPVPVGAVGELAVGGPGLALGYLGDEPLTARRFVDDADAGRRYLTGDLVRLRADGTVEFLGRTDEQVKIRGHRVEPGEVQWALARLPDVRDAAVLARRDGDGEAHLVAYVVGPTPGVDLDPRWSAPLRTALAAALPAYLVPDHWVLLERLPVNASGKLRADALPDPVAAKPGPATATTTGAPADPTEQALHLMWCTELRLESVPLDRSFFDLGGNSLKAVRILSRIRDRFGYQHPLGDFMREPTVRAVARAVAQRTA
ncbi:amino acid adenylation domain-containing protein [Kitasatospora sp. NPDC048365]|uniref:amino acid adenylation domain-containing protein n=1 Tax=Kitasatospora sp. NPDC048365 TaxID=3364050 RepID=UPI0037231F7C